jgi:hypothetical protein
MALEQQNQLAQHNISGLYWDKLSLSPDQIHKLLWKTCFIQIPVCTPFAKIVTTFSKGQRQISHEVFWYRTQAYGENLVTSCLSCVIALHISSFFLRQDIFRIPLCSKRFCCGYIWIPIICILLLLLVAA